MLVLSCFLPPPPSPILLPSSGPVETCWPSALWHFQKQKAIKYKHGVSLCFFFTNSLLTFDSFLFCSEAYWDGCIAKQSCDELLIDDSFIKAPCCTRTWHFLTLNLQRTDTNAFMSFKLVYKLGRVCGPRFKKTWRPGTDRLGLKASTDAEEKVRLCAWLCVWENLHQTLKNVWRTQPFSFLTQRKREQTVLRMPGENTVQIMWGWREQIREKAVCSSSLRGKSSTDSQVRELKEK